MRRHPVPGRDHHQRRSRRHPRPDRPQFGVIPVNRRPPRGSPTPHRQRPKINDGKRALPQHNRAEARWIRQVPRHPPVPPGNRQPRPWSRRSDTPPRPRRRPKQPPLRVPMELRVVGLHPPKPRHPGPHRNPARDQPRPPLHRQPRRARPAPRLRHRSPSSPIQREPPIHRTRPRPHPAHIQRPHSPLLRDPPQYRRGARRHVAPKQPANPHDHHMPRRSHAAADRFVSAGRRCRPREHTRHGDAHAQDRPGVSLPALHGTHLITVATRLVPLTAFDQPPHEHTGTSHRAGRRVTWARSSVRAQVILRTARDRNFRPTCKCSGWQSEART